MTQQIHVEGLKRFRRELREIAPEMVAEIKTINIEAAEMVLSAARPHVPQRSGALAGTGRVSSTVTTASVKYGAADVPYAAPIHWGWPGHGIAAQKFVYEGLDESEPAIVTMYDHRINELVDRAFSSNGIDA